VEKQNELVLEILKRLSGAGVLERVLLIGSWAASFYRGYFRSPDYAPVLRTRDIDFLIAPRTRFSKPVDLHLLLKDLGFDLEFSPGGYMRLESDELILEMLSPEVGPPKNRPLSFPDLKFNAQPLRHLSTLSRDPIVIDIEGVAVHLPHPADFALHKLVISDSRKNREKKSKDIESAYQILEALLSKEQESVLRLAFQELSQKEQQKVRKLITAGSFSDRITFQTL